MRDWARGNGRHAKSDALEAMLLAQYGAERRPPCWHPLAAEVAELERLLRRKDDVEQMSRQERNRQHALAGRPNVAGAVPDTISRVITALDETLLAREEAIAAHLRAHAASHEDVKRLRSVPGIGAKKVASILVLLHRWMTLTADEGTQNGSAASIGLDPQTDERGTSVRRRAVISRMGDQAVRRRRFMGALGGVRGDNPSRTFSQRLTGRGRPEMVALIAAARKRLTWAWAVFCRQVLFDAARNAPTTAIATDTDAGAYACASAA